MSNKEKGNYRPHYYAIQDRKNPKLYWMISISSQAEKYKGIIEKKKKRYGKCVINVGDDIGESTRTEIKYAKTHGKKVRCLEKKIIWRKELSRWVIESA